MTLVFDFIILFVSLSGLIVFSDKLIESSVNIAKSYGISNTIIGITLLAYGTSLPELVVSSISSISEHPQISISNVIGSNIINIALVIGIAAFIHPFAIKEKINRDALVMLISTIFLSLILFINHGIPRIVGVMMVLVVSGYTYYIVKKDIRDNHDIERTKSSFKDFLILVVSLLLIIISGKITINSAVSIAKTLGVTEWVIGATIIALGTSLPELAVSITAAKKGHFGMSAGNIVGSNIFNILWVLGVSASLNAILVDINMIFISIVFLLSVTFLFTYHLKKKYISRNYSILYVTIYIGYVLYMINF